MADVAAFKTFLNDFGFKGEQKVLTDDSQGDGMPTREGILTGLKWLVQGAVSGDSLFLLYSGHGTHQQDENGDEEDGQDEAIVPCDEQLILDDELYEILVKDLPQGVKLVCMMDCCHSGSIIDLPYVLKATGQGLKMERDPKAKPNAGGLVIMVSGCMDNQTSADLGRGGAMSLSFADVMRKNPQPSYENLIKEIRNTLMTKLQGQGDVQVPQLASSVDFNDDSVFSLYADGSAMNGQVSTPAPEGEDPNGMGGQDPNGQDPNGMGGQDPNGMGGQDPYGQDPNGMGGQAPYGEDPNGMGGQDPYGMGGQDPNAMGGQDPYGQDPYGQDPNGMGGQDPNGMGGMEGQW
jgi:hypothetical protein